MLLSQPCLIIVMRFVLVSAKHPFSLCKMLLSVINWYRHEHISQILSSLLWLPVQPIINVNIFILSNKSLNVLVLPYISDLLQPSLHRSADELLLVVPKTRWDLFPLCLPNSRICCVSASSLSLFKSLGQLWVELLLFMGLFLTFVWSFFYFFYFGFFLFLYSSLGKLFVFKWTL